MACIEKSWSEEKTFGEVTELTSNLDDNMPDGRLAQRISAEKFVENSPMSLTIRNLKMEPMEATLFIQDENLRAARDLLLPRLMSGEIAV